MREDLERFHLAGLAGMTQGRPDLKVAIIDGPVDSSHPELREAAITQLGAAAAGCRVTPSLACRHGTFVAGILVAARSSRAPALCPGCSLLVRPIFCEALVFGQCPVVTEDDLAAALMEVIDAGARIVNLSMGLTRAGGARSRRLRQVYDHARASGVLLVGASGNQSLRRVNPLFAHPWLIPVAAADRQGRIDRHSNLGDFVSRQGLLAPGVEVRSLLAGGGYRRMSGSSFATAFVTGALALLWSLYPRASAEQLRRAILRPDTARAGGPPLLDGEAGRRALAGIVGGKKGDLARMIQPNTTNLEQTGGASKLEPAQLPGTGGSCNASAGPPSHIYVVGLLRPTFPSLSVEREYLKAVSQVDGATPASYYKVFTHQDYRYLYIAQKVCWLLEIGGVDAYYLKPRSTGELKAMIECMGSKRQPPVTVVLGRRGPVAPVGMCGLELPIVLEKQIFPFDVDQLMADLKDKHGVDPKAITGVLRSLEIKPNPGASDGDRALNYLGFRYYQLYLKADKMHQARDTADLYLRHILTEPESAPSARRITDVIFEFQHQQTGEQQFYYCGIDVTGLFPFVKSPLRVFVTADGE